MKKPEKGYVEYVGYKHPETIDELELEICGLKTAIAAAQSRITALEQSKKLYEMGFKQNEKTVEEGLSDNEAQQESGTGLDETSSEDEKQD